MGKIGDLFVRLGLKSDDYKKGMADAKKETNSFSTGLSKMKAGAIAVWAAVGTAVLSFANEFKVATNKVNDAWEQTMAGIKAGWHTVLSELSNTSIDTSGSGSKLGNWFKNEAAWWKQLFSRTKEAASAGKEAAKAFDAEFELVNSVKLQREKIRPELNKLYADIRDTTLSPFARKQAMAQYKGLLAPIAQAEIDTYSNMLDAAVDLWQAGTGITHKRTTEELMDFFTNYGTDQAGMTAKYGDLAAIYETKKGDKQNQQIFDLARALLTAKNEMSNLDKEMARASVSIKKSMETMFNIGGDSPFMWAAKEMKDTKETIADVLDDIESEFDDFDVEIDLSDLESELEASNQKIVDETMAALERAQMYGQVIEDAIIGSITNGMQALTDVLFNLEDANSKQVLAAFIAPFGDTLKQMGAMIMAEGIAMEAFKKSFTNPYAAIAAGAALIAIGSVVSSGLQKLTANPASGGSGSASSYGGGASSVKNYEAELTVNVVGHISGSDIALSLDRTRKNQKR